MKGGLVRWLGGWMRGKKAQASAPAPAAPPVDAQTLQALDRAAVHYQVGEHDRAEAECMRALESRPDLAGAHFYLGMIRRKRGEPDDAADHLLMAATFSPEFTEAWFQLGVLELGRRNFADARRYLDTVLRLEPRHVGAHATYADVRERQKRFAAAIGHWKAVAEADPANAFAYCKLCRLTLRESQDGVVAMDYAARALALQPRLAEAHSCHAQVLLFQGRVQEAIEACEVSLQLDPDASYTRMIRALALLSVGEFAAGWRDYEARKGVYPLYAVRKLPFAEWDGAPLAGRRLLIYQEQGLGDEIMFASCFPDALRSGADCVIECSPRLETLFARSFPAARVISAMQNSPDVGHLDALPPCDFQVAAGSLPRFFRNSAADFAGRSAFLCADAAAVVQWRERFRSVGPGLNIGIAWRGGVRQTNQAGRSLPLAALLPLLAMPGCNFVSLQHGEQDEELALLQAAHGVHIRRWPVTDASIDDTAAMVSALDLVVSVTTTVAHLAAALGCPTWVLVPYNPEWRYQTTGSRMPWYPDMRLFRRRAGADWDVTIREVASAFECWRRDLGKASSAH